MTKEDWYFLERGQGPNLVLLHGLGASSFSWRDNLEPLAQHFRVLAPDLPPHGRSRAPLDANYTVAIQLQGLQDFLDRRGIERAFLAGNSLGGGLALLLAASQPERFPALVLLAPAVAVTRIPYIFYPLRLPLLGLLSAALLGPWIIPLALPLIYGRRKLITPEVVRGYTPLFRSLRRRLALGRLCRQLEPWPLAQVESLLEQLQQPVSLIWGDWDQVLPVKQAYWIKERLPNCHLTLLPEVGHAPQEEAPDEVNKIIIAFLRGSLNN